MKQSYCNPLDLNYRYQHIREGERVCGFREGADPTLVQFKGRYYMFVSMSAGFWHSVDMINWEFHADHDLLIYDYAPDARQIGDYLYFCASRRNEACPILRTADPLTKPFEQVAMSFDFWDPNLFQDDDGRVYIYWGCTNTDPIWGVELNRETMMPIGQKQALIFGRESEIGFERPGENGIVKKESSLLYRSLKPMFHEATQKVEFPAGVKALGNYSADEMTKIFLAIGKPYIEGAFMTKHNGKYYLQYAGPGTQYNTYFDGVYTSECPLGPFKLQTEALFSSKPGGFITGAGHGSTIADAYGNYWHASTMRVSTGYDMERRVGLFPAGIDADGILYCNQNFADYPLCVPKGKFNAQEIQPKWMLLSYKKPVTASSTNESSSPQLAVNEDIRTWWSAAQSEPGEWLAVDLCEASDVRAIQVNLADEGLVVDFPQDSFKDPRQTRHIELAPQIASYIIEISSDGESWQLLEQVARECVNAYYEYENGITARYIRVTGGALPYGQALRISGLRVFGSGSGEKPAKATATGQKVGDLDAAVNWNPIENAQGCNVRYGTAPDKLYQSWLVYDANEVTLSTLIKGQKYYICVDSFNENGITAGDVFLVE